MWPQDTRTAICLRRGVYSGSAIESTSRNTCRQINHKFCFVCKLFQRSPPPWCRKSIQTVPIILWITTPPGVFHGKADRANPGMSGTFSPHATTSQFPLIPGLRSIKIRVWWHLSVDRPISKTPNYNHDSTRPPQKKEQLPAPLRAATAEVKLRSTSCAHPSCRIWCLQWYRVSSTTPRGAGGAGCSRCFLWHILSGLSSVKFRKR